MTTDERQLQRPPAELLYAEELAAMREADADRPRPPGWSVAPDSVVRFVLGSPADGVAPKFVGSRRFVERCVVSLATNRGLMLIGEPGTAKSFLSELLAAAISGDSTLTVQGSAGTTEDDIKYSWNYALLLAEGPTERSLVPAPLYRGMTGGKLVRFEEITRCPLEVQDTLLSVLSDRVLHIPEFDHDARTLYAKEGFNVIATANTRDRGVHEMSAALKRRFNFETVHPIADVAQEVELVRRQTEALLEQAGVPLRPTPDLTEVLVTTFHELRSGRTVEGSALEPVSVMMSTAEAVAVAFSSTLQAHYFGGGPVEAAHVLDNLVGSAFKEDTEDRKRLQNYLEQVVRKRRGDQWEALYMASRTAEALDVD